MFSGAWVARSFAQLNQDQDILMWRYATEPSERRRQVIGYRILGLKLKQSVMGAFYNAAFNPNAASDISEEEKQCLKRELIHASALSPAEAIERALAMQACMEGWELAKAQNDFALVKDSLQRLLVSVRKEAQYKADKLGLSSPYEALMQFKTPGFLCDEYDRWADRLEQFSGGALSRFTSSTLQDESKWAMEEGDQKQVQSIMIAQLGYDETRGKIKNAMHPLCLGMHDDVRIGMRYNTGDFTSVLMAMMHEGGHALYRQGLPEEDKGYLSGEIAGVGMDEAMALLMENHVGRDVDFIAQVTAIIAHEVEGVSVNAQEIHDHILEISERPIRTQADEIRYPLDVILRYRIEKALVNGDMEVDDIPRVWAEEFERMTGIAVESDNDGALQDIHWFGGEIGWFPNYLVGQLAAAQLFEAAIVQDPSIETEIKRGNLSPLKDWLDENIYSLGASLNTLEIVERATGRPLDTQSYERHITERYLRQLPAPALRPHQPRP